MIKVLIGFLVKFKHNQAILIRQMLKSQLIRIIFKFRFIIMVELQWLDSFIFLFGFIGFPMISGWIGLVGLISIAESQLGDTQFFYWGDFSWFIAEEFFHYSSLRLSSPVVFKIFVVLTFLFSIIYVILIVYTT